MVSDSISMIDHDDVWKSSETWKHFNYVYRHPLVLTLQQIIKLG